MVISIIAVLAGILLPVTGAVMENAKKTSAKSTETQIITAIKSFQTDYGVYPALPSVAASNPPKDTTVGGTVGSNAELFAVLRATDTATNSANTRRIIYFEGKDVKTLTKPKDGFVPTGATLTGNGGTPVSVGDLVDPWGNRYFVSYDSGYSDQINNPYATTPASDNDDGGAAYSVSTMMRTSVVSWSYGKNGTRGPVAGSAPSYTSIGDDVVSWQ